MTESTAENKRELPFFVRMMRNKSIPLPLHYVLFGLCMCFGGWYSMRGVLALLAETSVMSGGLRAFLCNEVMAFLLGGVLSFLVQFVVTRFTYRMMLVGGAPAPSVQAYAFRTFYALGYLVYGAFSMIYFAVPMLALYGETIIRFVIVGAAVSLYVFYECRYNMPKSGRAVAVYSYGLMFSVIYLVYCAASLLMMIGR